MKRIISAVLLLVMCCALLTGCFCKHEWNDATCTTPTTCALCGKTEGNATGHIEGDLVEGEVDFDAKTVNSYQSCKVCGEFLHSETTNLSSFISGSYFVFTPNQYNDALAARYSSYDFEIATLDSGALITKIYSSSGSLTGAIMYLTTGNESLKMSDVDSTDCTGMICYWYTDDNAEIITLMQGILCLCDINLDDQGALDTLSDIIDSYEKGGCSKNGLAYEITLNDGDFVFLVSVD